MMQNGSSFFWWSTSCWGLTKIYLSVTVNLINVKFSLFLCPDLKCFLKIIFWFRKQKEIHTLLQLLNSLYNNILYLHIIIKEVQVSGVRSFWTCLKWLNWCNIHVWLHTRAPMLATAVPLLHDGVPLTLCIKTLGTSKCFQQQEGNVSSTLKQQLLQHRAHLHPHLNDADVGTLDTAAVQAPSHDNSRGQLL